MSDLSRTLEDLVARGLLVRHETPDGATYGFEPIVADRIADWMEAHPEERQGATEEQISDTLGQTYAASFESLADADDLDALEQAAEEAQYTLQSLLQAQSFVELNAFASRLVTGTRDPELLGQVLDDFTAAGVQVVFAEYRLRRILGVGTSSAVYEAERIDNALPVAVKVLRGRWSDEEDDVLRFLDDARLANRVRHPNVVEVFDAGHMEGTRFLVMELLRGRSLERRWRAKGRRLPLKRVLEIAMHVLGVLAAAHEKSILHGDIKPSNIFITSEGAVKVLDFGMDNLMRVAPPRRRFLEEPDPPSFLAPEQLRGELPDPRTDLWSLGSTMLALLGGKPADPSNPVSIMSDPSDVPPDIAVVIDRAIRPSREERWQSATQMWEAIAAIHAALGDPGDSVSDPGPGSAPLVETHPAGPLSERVRFGLDSDRPPGRSIRPAAGEPAQAQSSRSISIPPPPAVPAHLPPPPQESSPSAVVPLPAPLDAPSSRAQQRRAVEAQEAAKYLVPVTRTGIRWSPLLFIAVPVLVAASLITVLWMSLIDPQRTVFGRDDVTVQPPVQPTIGGPALCSDGVKNNTETDIDCGGGQCPPCAVRGACRVHGDCRTFVCAGGVCGACADPSVCPRGMTCHLGACVWAPTDAGSPDATAAGARDAGDMSDASGPVASTSADGGEGSGTKKNGDKCASAGECRSAFCVDGVCCNNACTGTCVACDLRTFTGMCAEIPFGYDPDRECGLKVCDGDGACGDRKVNGKRCKAGRECKSGFCSKGICCNTECRGADADCSTGACKRSLLIE
jgi:serine/threonine-protein kinase